MARVNAEQERWAVERASPRPDSRVLLVGHGPGVGLVGVASVVRPPEGWVIGIEPSAVMRAAAVERCAAAGVSGQVEIRDGSAEDTGCASESIDTAISVNNVMLWDMPAGFTELHRVLKPGGKLVITVHRHVLGLPPEELRERTVTAGFVDVDLNVRSRRFNSTAVELLARRADE